MTDEITTPIEIEAEAVPDVETIVIDGWTCHLTYSHLLPPLTPEEYAELKADIEKNGMLVPVLLSQTGQDHHYHVLDGQHRLRIAAELGLKWMDFNKNYRNLLTPEEREELALNLNLHRRHLTLEQRRELALKFRREGQSYRQIADKLGASEATVRRDVSGASNDAGELPDYVTGLDGKQYPAREPEETRTSKNAEKLLAYLAAQRAGAVRVSRMMAEVGLRLDEFTKAFNLIQAEKKIMVQSHALGNLVTLVAPSPVEVESTPETIPVDFDPETGEVENTHDAELSLEAAETINDRLVAAVPAGPEHPHEIVSAVSQRRWHTADGQPLCWVGRVETDKRHAWRANIYWRNPKTDADITFSASGASRLEAFRAARQQLERTARLVDSSEPENADSADREVRALAETMPVQQREMLVAIYRELPIPRQAATRTALINRGLLTGSLQGYVGGGSIWDHMNLTDKGRAVTAQIMLHPDLDPLSFFVPETTIDPVPARERIPNDHPRQPLSVDTAKELIIDALRQSQRPLGRGELRKYAGIDEADRAVAEQAIDVLLKKNVIIDVYVPGVGRRYHYADLIDQMTPPEIIAAAPLGSTIVFEASLLNAVNAINRALDTPAPDWSQIDTRREALIDLLRQAEDAAAALLHRVETTWWPRDVTAEV